MKHTKAGGSAVGQRPLGVGIIGAGPVTQAIHLPVLATLSERFVVARVMDVDSDLAERVAGRAGAVPGSSVEELLDDSMVDVVAVCSPHQFHVEQVAAACEAGVAAVLCEKPLAIGRNQLDTVAALARFDVPILVGAMHAFDPAWEMAAAAWAESGAKARVARSHVVLPPNSRFENFATQVVRPPAPRKDPARSPGRTGALHAGVLGLAVHDLPLIRLLLGAVGDLSISFAEPLPPFGYLICAEAGGVTIDLHAAMTQTWRPQWSLELTGDDCSLHVEFPPSYVGAGSGVAQVSTPRGTQVWGPYPQNGYQREWLRLFDVVAGVADPPALAEAVADAEFVVALADLAADDR